MHDPIQLNICVSDIAHHLYWKTNDGKVMLTITVAERREPSDKGNTHYATVYDKTAPDGEKNKYIAYGKFKPFNNTVAPGTQGMPPTADQLDAGTVSEAQVENQGGSYDDLPF